MNLKWQPMQMCFPLAFASGKGNHSVAVLLALTGYYNNMCTYLLEHQDH